MVSLLIPLAAVSSYVNHRYIKLPPTVGVMLVPLVASLALVLVGPYAGRFREQAPAMISRIDFNEVVFCWSGWLSAEQAGCIAGGKRMFYDGFTAAVAGGVSREWLILVDEQFGQLVA